MAMFGRVQEALSRTNGCHVLPALEAQALPMFGVGVVAKDHIPKDTLVYQASQEAWEPLSAQVARHEASVNAPAFISRLDSLLQANPSLKQSEFMSDGLVLSLQLLFAAGQPEQSQLQDAYLASLPTFVDLPFFWDDRQLEELQGCTDAKQAILQGNKFYSTVYKHLFVGMESVVDADAFMWAISILMSRATSGKQQPFALLPFFDWFNHSNQGDECVQEFDATKGFTVHTTRSYEPGEQLFISYGNHTNLRLLRNYGFTIPRNPHDIATMELSHALHQVSPNDAAFAEKATLLEALGVNPRKKKTHLELLPTGRLTKESELWLQILLSTSDELQQLVHQVSENDVTSIRLPTSLSSKVSQTVKEASQQQLERHATTLEEDKKFVADHERDMAAWLRACLYYRIGHKQSVVNAKKQYE